MQDPVVIVDFARHDQCDQVRVHATKCGAERICGADHNGDNLRINRAYLRISDHCSVTVRVRLRLGLRIVVYKLLEKVKNADQSRDLI